jgi:hypothetical protein
MEIDVGPYECLRIVITIIIILNVAVIIIIDGVRAELGLDIKFECVDAGVLLQKRCDSPAPGFTTLKSMWLKVEGDQVMASWS